MTTTTRIKRTYKVRGFIGRKLARAAELQREIAELQAKLDPLRDDILAFLNERNLDNVDVEDFRAIRKVRHKWTYTASTEREMAALRNLQKWEQQQGEAVDHPTVYLQLSSK